MRRRTFLSTAATGAVATTAGCMGGNVVLSKNETVAVSPHRGAIFELPAKGDKIRYIARDERPFDVYVFEAESAMQDYRAFIEGQSPSKQPAGNRSLGGHAVEMNANVYEVSTKDRGRQPLHTDSTAYFVLDHSNYRDETTLGEQPKALSVSLDLEVVADALPI